MTVDKIERLRGTNLLRTVDDSVLKAVADCAHEQHTPAGGAVFAQGDPGDAMYVVCDGAVRIHMTVATGDNETSEITLDTMGPGRTFGTLALLDDGPRSANATVEEDAVLLTLYSRDVLPILNSDTRTAEQLLRGLATIVRHLNRRLANIAYLDAPGLVAQAILVFDERYGDWDPEVDGARLIKHDVGATELAAQAGLLPTEVQSSLMQWQLERVIEPFEGGWRILQPTVLDASARRYRMPPTSTDGDEASAKEAQRPELQKTTIQERASALRESPLLNALPNEALMQLAERTNVMTIAAGDTVFTEGSEGYRLFVLRQGEVRIHMTSPTGTDLTLSVLRPPQTFGELTLLDGEPRSASATAEAPSELLWLHRDDFAALLEREPSIIGTILRSLAAMIRDMNSKLGTMALLDRRGRVCQAIVSFHELYGSRNDDGDFIAHPMKPEDLASAAGLYAAEVERIITILAYDHYLEPRIDGWLLRDLNYIRRCAKSYR